jgi:hypothetical protein
MPPDLVMTPSLPVTPGPAVAGPSTGTKNSKQVPVHFDVVGVSNVYQYKTKPLEFVSTFVPLTVAAIRVELAAGVGDAVILGVGVGVGLPELPHAAMTNAVAASPAALHILRILLLPFTPD